MLAKAIAAVVATATNQSSMADEVIGCMREPLVAIGGKDGPSLI